MKVSNRTAFCQPITVGTANDEDDDRTAANVDDNPRGYREFTDPEDARWHAENR